MFTRARLVLAGWYTVVLAATVLAIGLVAYFVVRDTIDREIDRDLMAARDSLLAPIPNYPRDRPQGTPPAASPTVRSGSGQLLGPDEQEEARRAAALPSDVFYVTTRKDGEVLTNPRQVDLNNIDFEERIEHLGSGQYWQDENQLRTLTFKSNTDAGWYLTVGRSLSSRDQQLRTLAVVLIAGGMAGVAFSAAGGLWLAGVALRPIRASLDSQRRFVSDASHELRTPLAVVKANSELLLRHSDGTIEENFDQVEAITAEVDHMTRLVDDLLTLARADESRANLVRESLDLGSLLDEVGRDMSALAELRGHSLAIETGPVEVVADRHRLRQLAVILLDNAFKYTPSGGSVKLSCRRAGRWAEFSVEDNGPGIAESAQSRIFDRFYRVDSARTHSAGGTGLGLAIAQFIAEAHDGRITVDSKPGHGTTFTVRLPAE